MRPRIPISKYVANDWYWIVAGSVTQVFSSYEKAYVSISDARYVAWLAKDNLPSKIGSESSLIEGLAEHAPDCLPDNAAGIEARKTRLLKIAQTTEIGKVLVAVLFDHENRIKVLEKKTKLTKAQFFAAVKELL